MHVYADSSNAAAVPCRGRSPSCLTSFAQSSLQLLSPSQPAQQKLQRQAGAGARSLLSSRGLSPSLSGRTRNPPGPSRNPPVPPERPPVPRWTPQPPPDPPAKAPRGMRRGCHALQTQQHRPAWTAALNKRGTGWGVMHRLLAWRTAVQVCLLLLSRLPFIWPHKIDF